MTLFRTYQGAFTILRSASFWITCIFAICVFEVSGPQTAMAYFQTGTIICLKSITFMRSGSLLFLPMSQLSDLIRPLAFPTTAMTCPVKFSLLSRVTPRYGCAALSSIVWLAILGTFEDISCWKGC